MVRALQCAMLGTALLGGVAFAADAPTDLVLREDAKCTVCHDEADAPGLLAIGKTRHGVRADGRTPTCASCHGESTAHLGYKGSGKPPAPDVGFSKKSKSTAEQKNAACLACHEKDSQHQQWDGSAHATNGVACVACHETHTGHDKVRDKRTQPEVCFACHKDQRADSKKASHHAIGEGKVTCSDCHNPHGSAGPKMLNQNTVNETCYSCHAEKRGPFLFEHQPATEDCSSCHNPHGSNIKPLLKSRAPFLCQECHDATHASGTPVGPNAASYQGGLSKLNAAPTPAALFPSKNVVGNACMNCHTLIHGSNSPAGGYFQR